MITVQEIIVSDEVKEGHVRKLDFKWSLVDLDKINRTASDFICLSFNKPADQNRSDVILGPTHLKIKDRDPLETALLLEHLAVSLSKQAMLKQNTSPSIKSHEDECDGKAGDRCSGKLNRMSIRYRKSFKKKSLKSEEAIAPIQEDNNTACNNMKSLDKSGSHKNHHTKQKSNNITRNEPIAKDTSILNENKFLSKIKSRAIPKHTRSVSQGTERSNKSEKKLPKKKEHNRETSLSGKRDTVPSGKRDTVPSGKRDSIPSGRRESVSSSKRESMPTKSESVTIIPNISSPLATPKNNLPPLTARNQTVEQLPPNHRASRKDCNCILCLYEHSQKSKTVLHNKENMYIMPFSSPSDTGKSDQAQGSDLTFEEIQQTLKEMYNVKLISN